MLGVLFNQSSSIAFDETSSYCPASKTSIFSTFHWSPHGSLVSLVRFGNRKGSTFNEKTETSLITELDRSGRNHRIGPGCAGRAIAGYR